MAECDGALRGRATSTLAVGPGELSFFTGPVFFGLSWFIVFGFFSFLDLNFDPFLTWFYCLLFISVHQARSSCFYIDREHKPLLMKVNREFVETTNRNLCSHQEFGDRGWTTLFLEDFQLYGLVSERGC